MKRRTSRKQLHKAQSTKGSAISLLAPSASLCGPSAPCIRWCCVLLAACCATARADVVAVKDRAPLVNTQVLRLADGKLYCRGESVAEVAFPIEQIEYMQITGWQMFNLAEKQRRTGDWHRAAASYERALIDLQSPESPLDRKLLVECRLIQACDAQARFTRALELYLDILERMPTALEILRPTRMPETGMEWLRQAESKIDAAIARHPADDIGKSLTAWKSTWPQPTATAPEAATPGATMTRFADERTRAEINTAASHVQAGRFDEALARLAAVDASRAGPLRAELYYWQGRALELSIPPVTTTPTSRPASTQPSIDPAPARAGLAYMRVVVHFPHHPLAPECLYRAGALCRRTGQLEQGQALWSDLMAAYPQAKGPDEVVWAERARKESQ